jgi:hypothetical protein
MVILFNYQIILCSPLYDGELGCVLHLPPFTYKTVYIIILHLYVTLITPISLTGVDWILRRIPRDPHISTSTRVVGISNKYPTIFIPLDSAGLGLILGLPLE